MVLQLTQSVKIELVYLRQFLHDNMFSLFSQNKVVAKPRFIIRPHQVQVSHPSLIGLSRFPREIIK